MKAFFFALGAFVLHQYAVYCQVGLTHDSHYYLAAAKSLATEGVLLNPDGSYFTNWTPLFPFVLCFIPESFLGFFQGGILFFSLFFFQKIAFQHIKKPFFQTFFSLVLCFSPSLLLSSVFLWSENLFILLLVGVFHFFERYLLIKTKKEFILLIFCSFLLCLQRHAGVFFVLGIGIYYVLFANAHVKWQNTKSDRRSDVIKLHLNSPIRGIAYILLSLSGWAVWAWRNFTLQEPSLPTITTRLFEDLGHNLQVYTESFSLFFIPTFFPFALKTFLVCFVFLFLVYFFLKSFSLPCFLTLFYLFCMVSLEKANFWEVERFVSPIYLLLFLTITIFLDKISFKKQMYASITYFLVSFWVLYPIFRTLKNILFWYEYFCA